MTDTEKAYNELAAKTVQYIEDVEPRLAKLAEAESARSAFAARATKAASVLVERGLLAKSQESEFVDKVAEAPEQVFDVVEKLAREIGPASLGTETDMKVAGVTSDDPFEKAFFPRGGNTGTLD